ncbi:CotH kinase family protein [Metasolibacillus sp.]|uniref:CotH kinase family protein n=1 Tax=Metasolibacillus sp. TaxID=2703680 RepID=UPI0025D6EDF8|nr:CotH kinase family protein [Metasolibacillus sp.]MCT6925796.1 CotH kinase family protein [Metasolibacillus sp.]MCT6941904.1 CotH kinase family protein [Metasolibacillus sp.]
MIKSRVVYLCMATLLLLFIVMVAIIPNIGIQTTNAAFSYEELVFNQSKVTTVDIEISEEDWQSMLENAVAEEYKEATVTVNGKRMEHVAIRTKGNLTLNSVVNSDSDRYSFKIDFDYYDNEQSLYGLTKLNLNNNYSDTTLMREYISYEIMEEIGLPTPAHSYMYITVNGQDQGLYLGVEQVDETFLANNFGSNDGFLYKPDGVGSDLKYISDDLSDYTGIDLKTNEANAESSKWVEMVKALSEGGDLEQYLDVDEILRYFAVNTALVNLDSYQSNLKHNYYLYEENGVFSIIPWDYNMSFGGFSMGMGGGNMPQPTEDADMSNANGIGRWGNMPLQNEDADMSKDGANMQRGNRMGMDMMGQSTDLLAEEAVNFSIYTPVSGISLEERPLLNTLLSNDEYLAIYEGYLEEVATTYLTEQYVQNITNNLAALLTTYVEADPTKFSTTEQFLEAVKGEKSLPEFAKQRSASILKQLSGELVIEASTTSSNEGFPERFQNGEMNGQPPANWNEDEMELPANREEGQQGAFGQPPANWNGDQMQPPNREGGQRMPNGANESTNNTAMLVIGAVTLILLIAATIFVFKFNRRGSKKKRLLEF